MGFSVSFTGCVKRPKECWNETHTINGSARGRNQRTRRREPAGSDKMIAMPRAIVYPPSRLRCEDGVTDKRLV